jgi:hypothetical protein
MTRNKEIRYSSPCLRAQHSLAFTTNRSEIAPPKKLTALRIIPSPVIHRNDTWPIGAFEPELRQYFCASAPSHNSFFRRLPPLASLPLGATNSLDPLDDQYPRKIKPYMRKCHAKPFDQ